MRKAKDIRDAVEAELAADPLIDAASITVISLDGDVALNGTAHSYPQYVEAAKAAWRAPGVTDVSNHLEVVLPPEHRRDDAMLTTAANNTLAASATVPEGVEATAKNGDVTLVGMVNYRSDRAAAEAAVSGLTGVRMIKDAIELRYDVDPADVNQLVMQALERHKEPQDSSHLDAYVTGSAVVLSGRVRTQAQHDAVVGAAWLGHGVTAVVDEVDIAE
jgi:osmotically-inducible protein OsmY